MKILKEENELQKRAKYHKKRQKGMSPFYSPDGGNVPLAIDRFNNSVADGANGLCESIDGYTVRDGLIRRIDSFLSENKNADKPVGYIDPHSNEYNYLKIKYGNYVTTPFVNVTTDEIINYALNNGLVSKAELIINDLRNDGLPVSNNQTSTGDYIVTGSAKRKYSSIINKYNKVNGTHIGYNFDTDPWTITLRESLNERFTFNPLKEVVLKICDFLWEEGFAFPGDDLLADDWNNVKDGVEMGVDPLDEVAQFLVNYLEDTLDNVAPEFYPTVKKLYNSLLKYLPKNEYRGNKQTILKNCKIEPKGSRVMESLREAWFTPLSEVSSFTGWNDDDALIDEEERFNARVEKALNTNRNDIQVLIDSDFEYDPRSYDFDNLIQLQEVKTKNIRANKYSLNGIEFVFEDSSSNSSPRLYFKSEEDGEAYTNYIDHYYDEEV